MGKHSLLLSTATLQTWGRLAKPSRVDSGNSISGGCTVHNLWSLKQAHARTHARAHAHTHTHTQTFSEVVFPRPTTFRPPGCTHICTHRHTHTNLLNTGAFPL